MTGFCSPSETPFLHFSNRVKSEAAAPFPERENEHFLTLVTNEEFSLAHHQLNHHFQCSLYEKQCSGLFRLWPITAGGWSHWLA